MKFPVVFVFWSVVDKNPSTNLTVYPDGTVVNLSVDNVQSPEALLAVADNP